MSKIKSFLMSFSPLAKLFFALKFTRFKNQVGHLVEINITSTLLPKKLNEIFEKHGSDKGSNKPLNPIFPWSPHSYGGFYEFILTPIKLKAKYIFECGIGTNNVNIPSNMGRNAKPGASLRAWRDFFLNAQIYGVDIDPKILFSETRIHTHQLDQTSPDSIKNYFSARGKAFDVMIDDGLHTYDAGVCLFYNSINWLSECGYYIIEDIADSDLVKYHKYFSSMEDYSYLSVKFATLKTKKTDNNIFIIQKNAKS